MQSKQASGDKQSALIYHRAMSSRIYFYKRIIARKTIYSHNQIAQNIVNLAQNVFFMSKQ
jgi:hypothetical protein